ncbi:uncharacterized protein LOC119124075 [Syngnathus acus]|uniref:uncharacterized protein LOC119124075 n=1 Tax=Syngnathus acus TaxID=161584 RepID=UPI001885AFEF|nr:uncharacterized protein LOC119124075 [Syngnathus acus]
MRSTFVVVVLLSLGLAAAACGKLNCSEHQHSRLICFNDYNRTITCVWNSSDALMGGGSGAACSLHAQRINHYLERRRYKSECVLGPPAARTPSSLRTCSLVFSRDCIFQCNHVVKVHINCSDVEMRYRPACHVKLPPPGKPEINQSSISWAIANQRWSYNFQLEWKLAGEPWNGASVRSEPRSELRLERLRRGAAYEARLRVRPSDGEMEGLWSDWSPVVRWTSDVGKDAAPPAVSLPLVLGVTISGTTFAVFLALLLFRADKTNWLYVFKKIRGPLLPDPGKSFLHNKWERPPFSIENLQFFLRPVDILAVRAAGGADPEAPGGPADREDPRDPLYPGGSRDLDHPKALLEKMMMMMKTTAVGFPPLMDFQLCPPPIPVASLTLDNLKACAPDDPYGPTGALADQDQDGQMKLLLEALGGFSRGGDEVTPVISDYEKIEKVQSEHLEETGGECQGEGGFPFEGISLIDTIQVSLDYERFRTLGHHDGPELPSSDSGIGGVAEEHGGPEESFEDEEERAPVVHRPPGCESPLGFRGPILESLQALMLDATDLDYGSVEPSSDGYMSLCPQDHVTS